jgi:hypothetical protein
MTTKLNVEKPESLIYENGLIRLTILGGIKIESLDRLRATLKAELPDSPKPPIRHNLDLYNDNQLEKFIRKTAERLEIGTSVIAASLSELTEQLEAYRLEKIRESEADSHIKPKILSKEEQEQAENYLKSKNLLQRTTHDLTKSGIIGEQDNALILYLAMCSRKTSEPLSVINLAKSGMGKSYLMERVAACFPEEELLENTQFTENSFYYFKREEIRGKVFLIEDLDGAQAVMYPIRELQSKKRISKTVTVKDKLGQLRTVSLVVEGPVSVVACTTKEHIYEDNANRSILLYLDGSPEQDQRILDYQKQLKAGLINSESERQIQNQLQDVQRILAPVKIINPYAPLIDLPTSVFKPRRTMNLLLNFIEAITFYHQRQRPQRVDKSTGEIYIETTPEDIKWAFKLLRETLFRKSDELSGACRIFYEYLKDYIKKQETKNISADKVGGFYASEIRKEKRINPRTLNRYLQELVNYNRINIIGGNKHKTGYRYQLNDSFKNENLQEYIDIQVSKVMEQVKTAEQKNNKSLKEGQTKTRVGQKVTD